MLPLLSQAMPLTWDKREGDRLTTRGYGAVRRHQPRGGDRSRPRLRRPATRPAGDRQGVFRRHDGGQPRRRVQPSAGHPGRPVRGPPDAEPRRHRRPPRGVRRRAPGRARRRRPRSYPTTCCCGLAEAARLAGGGPGQLGPLRPAHRRRRRLAQQQQNASFLYGGAHLAAVQQAATQWAEDPERYPALTGVERDFLRASHRAATRRRRLLASAVAVITVLAIVASTLLVVVSQLRNTAVSLAGTKPSITRPAPALRIRCQQHAAGGPAQPRRLPHAADIGRDIATDRHGERPAVGFPGRHDQRRYSGGGQPRRPDNGRGRIYRRCPAVGCDRPGAPAAAERAREPPPVAPIVTPTFSSLAFSPQGHILAALTPTGPSTFGTWPTRAHPRAAGRRLHQPWPLLAGLQPRRPGRSWSPTAWASDCGN